MLLSKEVKCRLDSLFGHYDSFDQFLQAVPIENLMMFQYYCMHHPEEVQSLNSISKISLSRLVVDAPDDLTIGQLVSYYVLLDSPLTKLEARATPRATLFQLYLLEFLHYQAQELEHRVKELTVIVKPRKLTVAARDVYQVRNSETSVAALAYETEQDALRVSTKATATLWLDRLAQAGKV